MIAFPGTLQSVFCNEKLLFRFQMSTVALVEHEDASCDVKWSAAMAVTTPSSRDHNTFACSDRCGLRNHHDHAYLQWIPTFHFAVIAQTNHHRWAWIVPIRHVANSEHCCDRSFVTTKSSNLRTQDTYVLITIRFIYIFLPCSHRSVFLYRSAAQQIYEQCSTFANGRVLG